MFPRQEYQNVNDSLFEPTDDMWESPSPSPVVNPATEGTYSSPLPQNLDLHNFASTSSYHYPTPQAEVWSEAETSSRRPIPVFPRPKLQVSDTMEHSRWVEGKLLSGHYISNHDRPHLPKLQVSDESSPSKPDNFRVSPVSATSSLGLTGVSRSRNSSPSMFESSTRLDLLLKSAIPEKSSRKPDLMDHQSSPPEAPQNLKVTNEPIAALTFSDEMPVEAVLQDWSGRGTHVDYGNEEQVPLIEGRFLGHGSMGSVFETTIRGHTFAWKKRYCRRRIGKAERKEIEILKKVSHHHIIKLAGSYTHRHFLGLLLYPVAVCDLATLFEDSEVLSNEGFSDDLRQKRLKALGIEPEREREFPSNFVIWHNLCEFIRPRIGCIISAVEYLHNQRIRHKDLKPSNILISADNLWLTDFGTATDFSDRTVSTTDSCERGTPKYFAPEMAAFEKCGRSADIFSLGCVLLEMFTLQRGSTLQSIQELRPNHDKSFQGNLARIIEWLSTPLFNETFFDSCVRNQIRKMLARDPSERPTISNIRITFALLDSSQSWSGNVSLFHECCKHVVMSREDYNRHINFAKQIGMDEAESTIRNEINQLKRKRDSLRVYVDDLEYQVQRLNTAKQAARNSGRDLVQN